MFAILKVNANREGGFFKKGEHVILVVNPRCPNGPHKIISLSLDKEGYIAEGEFDIIADQAAYDAALAASKVADDAFRKAQSDSYIADAYARTALAALADARAASDVAESNASAALAGLNSAHTAYTNAQTNYDDAIAAACVTYDALEKASEGAGVALAARADADIAFDLADDAVRKARSIYNDVLANAGAAEADL